jgi:hypothetical protein
MSEPKTVVWFGDDPQPNTFFFRSPFRSWKFAINTVLLIGVSLGCAFLISKQPSFMRFSWLVTFLLMNVVSPYWWALKRHGRINELYRSGKIEEQSGESPLNDLLELADNSLNEGLRNTSFVFGLLLFSILMCKLHYFK